MKNCRKVFNVHKKPPALQREHQLFIFFPFLRIHWFIRSACNLHFYSFFYACQCGRSIILKKILKLGYRLFFCVAVCGKGRIDTGRCKHTVYGTLQSCVLLLVCKLCIICGGAALVSSHSFSTFASPFSCQSNAPPPPPPLTHSPLFATHPLMRESNPDYRKYDIKQLFCHTSCQPLCKFSVPCSICIIHINTDTVFRNRHFCTACDRPYKLFFSFAPIFMVRYLAASRGISCSYIVIYQYRYIFKYILISLKNIYFCRHSSQSLDYF